jgi:hypothetical protein
MKKPLPFPSWLQRIVIVIAVIWFLGSGANLIAAILNANYRQSENWNWVELALFIALYCPLFVILLLTKPRGR